MEIDWSKAPEWAVAVGSEELGAENCYLGDKFYSYIHTPTEHYIYDVEGYGLDDFTCIQQKPFAPYGFNQSDSVDSHYNKTVKLRATQQDADQGYVEIKLDPHLVSVALGMNGGPLEHIFKKAWRGTDKGHDLITVYKEIRALCDRAIEIDECLVE